MGSRAVWIMVALVCALGQIAAAEHYRYFEVELTEKINPQDLVNQLNRDLSSRFAVAEFFFNGKATIGQKVASLLAAAEEKKKPVLGDSNVYHFLRLNKLEQRRNCEEIDERRQACEAICSKEEAELDVPPTGSDWIHLNLGKYCWEVYPAIHQKCVQLDNEWKNNMEYISYRMYRSTHRGKQIIRSKKPW